MSSPFEVLGIPADATPDQVREAWRELARKTHPDAGGLAEDFRAGHAAFQAALKIASTPKDCQKCFGRKTTTISRGFFTTVVTCPECKGTGLAA